MKNKNAQDEQLKNFLLSEKDTTTIEKALSSAMKKWKTKKQDKTEREASKK